MRHIILRTIGRFGLTGNLGALETVGLTSAVTLCSAFWVAAAVPALSVMPGFGSDRGRGVSIALERALLGIDDGTGRRALGERLVAVADDRAVVDEHVLAAVVRGDEPVTLGVVEPLHGSCCHC